MQHGLALAIWIATGIALVVTAAWEAQADIRHAWRHSRRITIRVRTVRRQQ